MKTNLKVGDTFEVVEVLTNGDYDDLFFKIGGWTIGNVYENDLYSCLNNGKIRHRSSLAMWVDKEIKPVGRLVVTKIK